MKDVLNAYAQRDVERAHSVCERDAARETRPTKAGGDE